MGTIELKKNTAYWESDIVDLIKNANPSISDIKVKWLLFELEKNQSITRVGTKKYVTDGNRYSYSLSESGKKVDSFLSTAFPDVKYVIWESVQLNEWMNFLLAKNIIFVEAESDLKEYIFSFLQEKFGRTNAVLLDPDIVILSRYIDNCPIVVRSLFSRSPQSRKTHQIVLEKLVIDILSDKLLSNLIGTNDRFSMACEIAHGYSLNTTTAISYAKRRISEAELPQVLEIFHDWSTTR